MIERWSDRLANLFIELFKKENYSNIEYYCRTVIFFILSTSPIILFSYIFDLMIEFTVMFIVFNKLREYINGWHADTLEHCAIISPIYIITMCWISKHTVEFYSLFFILSISILLLMVKNIMEDSPIDFDYYDLVIFILIFSIIFYNLQMYNWLNAISFSAITVYLWTNKYTRKVLEKVDKLI